MIDWNEIGRRYAEQMELRDQDPFYQGLGTHLADELSPTHQIEAIDNAQQNAGSEMGQIPGEYIR